MPTHGQCMSCTCSRGEDEGGRGPATWSEPRSSPLPVPEAAGRRQDESASHPCFVPFYFCPLSNTVTSRSLKVTGTGSDKHFNKTGFTFIQKDSCCWVLEAGLLQTLHKITRVLCVSSSLLSTNSQNKKRIILPGMFPAVFHTSHLTSVTGTLSSSLFANLLSPSTLPPSRPVFGRSVAMKWRLS